MTYILATIAFLIGLKLPDVDLAPVFFMRHRSAWTHGPLPAIAICLLDDKLPAYHLAWMALLAGIAIHLLADCFPKSWQGSALINFKPLRGSLKPFASFALISFSAWFSSVMLYERL